MEILKKIINKFADKYKLPRFNQIGTGMIKEIKIPKVSEEYINMQFGYDVVPKCDTQISIEAINKLGEEIGKFVTKNAENGIPKVYIDNKKI